MTRWSVSTIVLASSLIACVGSRPIVDNQPCPCAPGWWCNPATNVCVANTGDSGTASDGGDARDASQAQVIGACGAVCSTPAGSVMPLTTIEDAYAAMEGTWDTCAAWPEAPSDVIGVEFGPASTAPTDGGSTVGGDMYYLVAGPSGPQRGSGFAYQLKYDISPEGPAAFQLNMHPAPNSGFGGAFRYSPCPREFEVEWYTKLLLVRNGVER